MCSIMGYKGTSVPGEKFKEVGRDTKESEKAVKYLQNAGYDMLNADNGTYDAWYWAHPPVYMPLACNLDDAKFIKKHVNIPVFCAGRMEDANTAVEVIESKEIDAVSIGRQFLADPKYVTKVKNDNLDDIKKDVLDFINVLIKRGIVEDENWANPWFDDWII